MSEHTQEAPRTVTRDLMQALDFPDHLRHIQDAYWLAQHEWEALDKAYRVVVADMFKQLDLEAEATE